MDQWKEYAAAARKMGFTAAEPFSARQLSCRPEIRLLCAPDKCTSYGTNWICPPGCGELPACAARLARYERGLLIVSRYDRVDGKNFAALRRLAEEYNRRLLKLRDLVRADIPEALLLSTGGCDWCPECTYPSAPCRKPELLRGALSAYGIDVAELCASAGVEYAVVPDRLYYVSCILG